MRVLTSKICCLLPQADFTSLRRPAEVQSKVVSNVLAKQLPRRSSIKGNLQLRSPLLERALLCWGEAREQQHNSDDILSASIPLGDVQQSLELAIEEGKQGKTIIVQDVVSGSRAQQNGIAAGQQLLALSSTDSQKFWTLDPQAVEERNWITAGHFAWEILGMSREDNVELVLSQPSAMQEGGAANSQASIASTEQQQSRSIRAELTNKYDQQYPDNPLISAAERRIKRRNERYEIESKRNDAPFFLLMLGVFVVPPLVIILIAYFSGYLDSLSGHYTDTH